MTCIHFSSVRETKKFWLKIFRMFYWSYRDKEMPQTRWRMMSTIEDGKTQASTMKRPVSSISEREKATPSSSTSRYLSSIDYKPRELSTLMQTRRLRSSQLTSLKSLESPKLWPTKEEKSSS
jgi:hypothetical protein